MNELLKAVASANSPWTMAAFAIAAVVLLLAPVAKRKQPGPILWMAAVVVCLLGALPIVANAFLEGRKLARTAVYRVRVTVLDPDGNPVPAARLHTTVPSEISGAPDGSSIVTVPAATLPEGGRTTLYAEVAEAFLSGRADLRLDADMNPAATVRLQRVGESAVTGFVRDQEGRAIPGATVTVIPGESGRTSGDGTFSLKAKAAPGQMVSVHAEKTGYSPVDQEHPSGRDPAFITLSSERRTGR